MTYYLQTNVLSKDKLITSYGLGIYEMGIYEVVI